MDGRFAISRLAGTTGVVLATVLAGPLPLWGQASVSTAPAPALAPATSVAEARSPDDVAWAMLEAVRDYIRAARLREPGPRLTALQQVGRRMMDLTDASQFPTEKDMQGLVTLWPSPLAHYVEGFDRRNLTVIPAADRAVAVLKATNPHDQKLADQLRQEITADLQKQGEQGEALTRRLEIRLRRELARRGVGMPLAATIRVTMARVDGEWKVRDVALVQPTPRSTATRPAGTVPMVRPQGLRGPATLPAAPPAASQPGQ